MATLQKQLEASFRDAIVSGELKPGQRILSTRELKTHLGFSRNTIVNAIEQLCAEGYLVTERSVGTFVASHVHAISKPPPEVRNEQTVGVPPCTKSYIAAARLSPDFEAGVNFRPGLPAFEYFPERSFKRMFTSVRWDRSLLGYGDRCGHGPLREALAQRLNQTRGVVCSADQILITDGAQSAFALICEVMLNAGDAVFVENPGYPHFRALLLARGIREVAVPVDEHGVSVESFRPRSRHAKLAYVTPSHQYPTGATLSLERRFRLLDWATKNDSWIIEDDYDSEFNYTGHPLPALQGLGSTDRVLYVGTFSKVLSPALRLGFIVVPKSLLVAFESAREVLTGQTNLLMQSAVARFIEAGHFGRHVAKMRKIYNERRLAASDALASTPAFRVSDTQTGLHFIVEIPSEVRDVDLSERASREGIVIPPLSSYFSEQPTLNGFVVGYAGTPVAEAKKAFAKLAELL